jgi:hypothetical protein
MWKKVYRWELILDIVVFPRQKIIMFNEYLVYCYRVKML